MTCAASRSGTRANADQNDPITPPPHAHRAPAKAGAQDHAAHRSKLWAPAFAGAQADAHAPRSRPLLQRSEEHTSELQSLMRISYAVFCLKKKTMKNTKLTIKNHHMNRTTDPTPDTRYRH